MMFEYGNNWSFWQVALMSVGMIAFWGLLIWGVYVLLTHAPGNPDDDRLDPDRDRGRKARDILDQRLAKGEIDTDEYHRVRDLIANNDRVPVSTRDQQ